MRMSDWSSDVCSSDLDDRFDAAGAGRGTAELRDRGGDRALRPRAPRTGRARQGHGLGCGVRDDDERAAVLGADPGAALDVKRPGPDALRELFVPTLKEFD